MAAAPKPPIDWTTPYLDSFRGVERAIRLSRGFLLLPVEASGPDLGRALGEWLTAQGYPAVIHEPRDDKAWEEIAGTLYETEVAPNGVVLVLGGPRLPRGFYEGVWLLNQKRDPIVKRLGRPLLWCGPDELLASMWERAPDLWSIRAVERRLEAAPSATIDVASARERASGPSYDVERDADVVALRKSLAESAYRIGLALALAGRLARADALTEADELLDMATRTESPERGDVRDVIEAWLLRASVERRQGRLTSAREHVDRAESIRRAQADYRWSDDWAARFRLERGRIALDEGNLEEARDALARTVEASRELDDPSIAVEGGVALANLYLETPGPGSAQRALEILDEAERGRSLVSHFAVEGGRAADADSEVDVVTTRARALAASGSTTEAWRTLSSAEGSILGELPPGGHAAALRVRLARTALDVGARDLAESLATRALDMARAAGDVHAERNAADALDRAGQAGRLAN
jgi:tetratricopeptide (TPR) repeat protein